MSFKQSLRLGELGETLFFSAYGDTLTRQDGFKSDFTINETGKGLELKTDFWCMSRTPNFFFERFSDKAKRSPGGPWQSIANGSTTFIYFYVKNLTFFKFDTAELIAALEEIIPTLKPTDVPNKTFTTEGYRVPRELLLDIAEEVHLEVSQVKKPKKKKRA